MDDEAKPRKKKIAIIGSGISSLSSACYLAKEGYRVQVFEKNKQLGGRCRVLEIPFDKNDESKGVFKFDIGPSWYWMPEIFENFFKDFKHQVSDYYNLVQLNPAYQIFFSNQEPIKFSAYFSQIQHLFQQLEPDGRGGDKLAAFLTHGKYTYQKAVNDYMLKPSESFTEFLNLEFLGGVIKAGVLKSYGKEIRRQFKSPVLRQILEYPVLFLGATPGKIPYLYSLMAYTMIVHGTWYPMGGMYKVIEAMVTLATELGVEFYTECEIKQIETEKGLAQNIVIHDLTKGHNSKLFEINKIDNKPLFEKPSITDYYNYKIDFVIAGADYNHVEQTLLDSSDRKYNKNYWNKRTMAPSAILYFLGVDKKIKNLEHHNLFFDRDFDLHSREIYDNPKWPTQPLFYLNMPSKTDSSVSPKNCDSLFVLIPTAVGLIDTQETRDFYYEMVIDRIEKMTGESLRYNIVCKQDYATSNFIQDYNAFKGNAYGLANTLNQTAVFKPSIKSQKVKNLFYCGQLTVPGPGMPPSIYSGKLAAEALIGTDK
jgi:phytoene desaturase